jgi:peptidoglycan/xylan/chitin deacetylase (PgdA/CDA1 family)
MTPLDPYGIYGNRTQYPDPKGTNGKLSRRRNYWTTNPPTLAPPPEEPAASAAGVSAAGLGAATNDAAVAAAVHATVRPSGQAPVTAAEARAQSPGSPVWGGRPATSAQYVTHGPRTKKWIALTFDADMYPWMYRTRETYKEYDPRLVKLLTEHDVAATIFFNGLYVKAYPDLVRQLSERPLLEMANHTWDHAGWTSCGNTDPIEPPMTKRKEVIKTEVILKEVTDIDVRYFRFPGGCYGGSSDLQLVKELGERPIGWDCYFGDALGWSAEKQIANVKRTCQRGSIVITHMNNTRYHPGVYRALKQLLPWWKEHGWKVVSVGTMLGKPTPPPG